MHQNHRHIVKDLPFGDKSVFLEINRQQFKCEKCRKPFSEYLDFVRKKRTYTKRLAQKTIQEVLDSDIHSVASIGIMTRDEIEIRVKDASEDNGDLKPRKLELFLIKLIIGIQQSLNWIFGFQKLNSIFPIATTLLSVGLMR